MLIGEDEQGNVLQVVFNKEGLKLFGALLETLLIRGVNDVNESISVLEVVLPVGADGALTTNVPHIQLEAILSLKSINNEFYSFAFQAVKT